MSGSSSFYIESHGCSASIADAEMISGLLKANSFTPVEKPEAAGLTLLRLGAACFTVCRGMLCCGIIGVGWGGAVKCWWMRGAGGGCRQESCVSTGGYQGGDSGWKGVGGQGGGCYRCLFSE